MKVPGRPGAWGCNEAWYSVSSPPPALAAERLVGESEIPEQGPVRPVDFESRLTTHLNVYELHPDIEDRVGGVDRLRDGGRVLRQVDGKRAGRDAGQAEIEIILVWQLTRPHRAGWPARTGERIQRASAFLNLKVQMRHG